MLSYFKRTDKTDLPQLKTHLGAKHAAETQNIFGNNNAEYTYKYDVNINN